MQILIISVFAFIASFLTLFSGFGLGTILTPVFALFFPIQVAIAITAIVHLLNNIFKLGLVGRQANKTIIFRFGIPAVVSASIGAGILNYLSFLPSLYSYSFLGELREIHPVKLTIGILIIIFSILEFLSFEKMVFDREYLSFGGLLSGFFGGLSGNQGALRSAFLIKAGLKKEEYIGSGVVIAVMVDTTRLFIYGIGFYSNKLFLLQRDTFINLIFATSFAFLGAFIASRIMKKVSMRIIEIIVALMMVGIGLGMITGLV